MLIWQELPDDEDDADRPVVLRPPAPWLAVLMAWAMLIAWGALFTWAFFKAVCNSTAIRSELRGSWPCSDLPFPARS